jgi:hypothetical protein
MSRHTTVVDLVDGFDEADEHDVDLLVDLLGLAPGRHAGHARPTGLNAPGTRARVGRRRR